MNASAARKPGFVLKGWHVLLMLVGFFGFMFVVNGIFLWAAITSFPGEDEQKSYMQGLHYNEIAEIMQCPENTVKTRMFHARRILAKSLQED